MKGATLLRYGCAVATVGLASLAVQTLWPLIQPALTAPFFGAVMISAWYGGFGPGLLATVSAVLSIEYFFQPPFYAIVFEPIGAIRTGVFVCVALLISWLNARRRSAEDALRAAGRALSGRVEEQTAALTAEIAERRRAEETANALARVGRDLAETLDLARATDRVVSTVLALFRVRLAALFRLDPASGALVCVAVAGAVEPRRWIGQVLPPGTGLAGRAVAQGRPVWTSDVLADPGVTVPEWLRECLRDAECGAAAAVPLISRGETMGVLALGDVPGRVFADGEIQLLSAFGDRAASALSNARLYEEAERRRQEAEVLAQGARVLAESLDMAAVGERIVESVQQLLRVETPVLWRLEPDGSLTVAARWGEAREHFDVTYTVPPGTGVSGRAVTEGRPVWTADALNDPRIALSENLRRNIERSGFGAILAVPLRAKGETIGALGVGDRTGRRFSDAEVALVQAFGDQAALALENARLYQETKQAYEALTRSQEQLVQAQKMEAVGRLAGGIAHDFNNLLTVILGRSYMLLRGLEPDDPDRRALGLIQHTGERASALTRQLLAFSRKQVLQPKVLDLNSVVAGVEPMLRRLIGEDIELVTVPSPDPASAKADPGQLEQVILNLAVNARDAMPRGGRLTIETANVEVDEAVATLEADIRPGKYVALAVSDTGIGIDPGIRAHLFEPFFTTKDPGKGTGLGLATVYGIVKQSDGFLRVESEPGRGARFEIYLPWVDETAEALEAAAAPAEVRGGAETVLLVEDDDGVREMTREILELLGYAVTEARDGAEALEVAARHAGPIHLLVTDTVMPRMNGPALAERLASIRPETRVLFMSGHTDDALLRHGVVERGEAFLAKPFAADTLGRKVRQVLDVRSKG